LGFTALPWSGARESFIVLDWRRVLAAASGWLAPAAAALAPAQAWRLRALQARGLPRAEESSEIGEEFDRLWQATQGLYANTNVRTSQALRWHCPGDAHVEKRLFVCRQKGRLAGYMILKARDRRGLKTWDCVDFWEDPAAGGTLEALLTAAWRAARERGLDLLSFPHFSRALGERLGRAGLFARASGRRALFLGAPGLLARVTAENSYLVGLQGDYGTAVS
jgi:hypothetical protein